MTAPTIAVTCVANDQNGNPVAGAVFTARLDSTEVYQGFVVPERVQVVADSAGIAVLNLWPNALGVAGSLYRVTAVNPDTGRKFLDTTISVPNSPCNLHEILVQGPYPTLDAAAQALVAAQGALAEVTALVFDAADSQAAAAASEAAAEADRVAALGSQMAAANSAAEATYSAGRIDLGALDNAVTVSTAQAVSATASAVEATTQRNAASVSAAAALASQGVTTTKAAEGATSAAAALASKNTATTQAGIATTGATTATTQAGIATTQAMSATTSKDAAATSATGASTSAGTATTKAGEASTSATAAAASATTATTQADLASGHATAAGTSAGTATTQATASAASAATSLAQANISTTKAGEAAASATASNTARAASVVAKDAAVVAKTAAETANGTAQTAATTATTQAGISTTGATAATTAKDLAQAAQAAAEAARDGATAVMSGGAGGVLSGSYPNPGFAVDMATQAELDNKVSKTGDTMTGDLSVPSLNGGPLAGLRNLIINGNFAINQRGYVSGAAVGAANTYTLDRWRVVTSGQNATFTALGNGNLVTAPAGGLEQVIEGLSITGGSYVINWNGTATCTVGGTARAKGATFTLTAGTNVTVRFSGGTVGEVQVEPGTVVTPFESRPIGLELMLCQRYYESGLMHQQIAEAFYIGQTVSFTVEKRAVPTVTFADFVGNASRFSSGGSNNLSISAGTVQSKANVVYMDAIPSASLTLGNNWWGINWTASAEL